MEKIKFKIQADLQKELELTFTNFAQIDIGVLSDAIERFIPSKIENILTDYTEYILPNSQIEYSQLKSIKYKNLKLQIRIYDSIEDPTELLVGYFDLFSKVRAETNSATTNIMGYGKYEKPTFIYPKSININTEIIQIYLKTVIESCYSWLLQKLKLIIKENTLNSSYLYAYIKALFPNQPSIYNSIWLTSVNNETVIYLLDEETVQFSIEQIKNYGLFKSEGPISQISHLLQMKLPYIETMVRQAASLNDSVSLNPLFGKYAEHSTLLAIGEASIYHEDATAMGITTEGSNLLFIVFPTKYINEIQPIFNENKEAIANEFKKFQSRIDRIFKLLLRQKYDLGDTGKFLGSFCGAFIKSSMD